MKCENDSFLFSSDRKKQSIVAVYNKSNPNFVNLISL